MSNRMRSSRYIGIALFIIMCCCILTGCRSHNSSVQELRNEEVVIQSTPIPQDTTIFNDKITSSAKDLVKVGNERGTFIWSSSNESIATVSSGKITAKKLSGTNAKTVKITAKTENGKTATCTVTVTTKSPTAISGIVVDGSSVGELGLTLTTEEEKEVGVSITPNDYDDSLYQVTWTTSDSSVVDIEEVTTGATGTSSDNETIIASKMASKNVTADRVKLVAGSTPGSATVTATIKDRNNNDLTKSISITVQYPDINEVRLDKSSATIEVSGTVDITATIGPSLVNNSTLYWSSSDTTVATVNCNTTNTISSTCTVTGVYAEAIDGGIVQTSRNLKIYLRWFCIL